MSSNNTNKLSPQELIALFILVPSGSNNTNKLSPQELLPLLTHTDVVQIIQINLVLKNQTTQDLTQKKVQIIQINLVLKNNVLVTSFVVVFK